MVGRAWSKVALRVTGRSQVQCRERFLNHLDPDRKPTGTLWSEAEKASLKVWTSSGMEQVCLASRLGPEGRMMHICLHGSDQCTPIRVGTEFC